MALVDDEINQESGSIRAKLIDLSDQLMLELEELESCAEDYATADNEARKAKAKAFLQSEGKNKEEREARADSGWANQRLEASLAESKKEVSIEKVRSYRAIMSAFQALLYSKRAEGEAIKYGQIHNT